MKPVWFALLLPALLSAPAFGSSVTLEGFVDFRVDGVRLPAGDYQVGWGQVIPGNLATPSVFYDILGSSPVFENDGFFWSNGVGAGELFAALTQDDNATIPVGAYMGLAITTLPYRFAFYHGNASNTVILWDSNWITPAFTADGPDVAFSLSSQTRIAYLSHEGPFSSYSYHPGASIINLVTIPEPSAFAVITGLGALGFSALRRRRRERR